MKFGDRTLADLTLEDCSMTVILSTKAQISSSSRDVWPKDFDNLSNFPSI